MYYFLKIINPFNGIYGVLFLVIFTYHNQTIAQDNHHCNSDLSTTISLVQPWQGNLDVNEAHCFKLRLRGVGCFARKYERFDDEIKPECHRDTQMGKHLLWLAEERYPDRKIIVWAGTAHIMRDPDFTDAGLSGPAMGKVVWDVLGEENYSIGMTSYQGEDNFIISDQHLLPEFEQLMNAAGFEYGFVDLRGAARERNWLSIPFLARPRSHHTENRAWSDKLDALFFVKEQERRRQVGKNL